MASPSVSILLEQLTVAPLTPDDLVALHRWVAARVDALSERDRVAAQLNLIARFTRAPGFDDGIDGDLVDVATMVLLGTDRREA
jgi:hypothetical protein